MQCLERIVRVEVLKAQVVDFLLQQRNISWMYQMQCNAAVFQDTKKAFNFDVLADLI